MNTWRLPGAVWTLLGIAAALELAMVAGFLEPMLTVEFVQLPWALIPVLAAAPFLISNAGRQSAATKFIVIAVAIVVTAVALVYGAVVGANVVAAIAVSALLEEAIFRLGVPGLIALGLIRLGLAARLSLFVGLFFGCATFVVLPGHVIQMGSGAELLVFVGFAALMSYGVWRGNSFWLVVIAHAGINFVNLGFQEAVIADGTRAALVVACLTAVVVVTLLKLPTSARNEARAPVLVDLRTATTSVASEAKAGSMV